ncbi:MAG: hypothetical protein KatS3mg111_2276 [Pirellulaceae bacterium]|nr:MAG: hypothetical protein KatS3mg111_2276 [Pirellulaceae bacterium]
MFHWRTRYRIGDKVIYIQDKATPSPGPRAKNIYPCPAGDLYVYQVEKYWVVKDVLPDGTLVLATRRGKERHVPSDDRRLRKASWWERLTRAHRFPELSTAQAVTRAA